MDQENWDGIIFAADIEKAFDSVEHDFIYASLRKFGFVGSSIQWISDHVNVSQSCVMPSFFLYWLVNMIFSLQRGTRQGDPCFHICLFLQLKLFLFKKAIRGFSIDLFTNRHKKSIMTDF